MAGDLVLVDTSVLIDYYRKTDKERTLWIKLIREGYSFAVSTVTKYEIYTGASQAQIPFWNNVFDELELIPFDESSVDMAIFLSNELKRKRKQIAIADLFIASTALAYQLPLATLNKKHFERIESLHIIL